MKERLRHASVTRRRALQLLVAAAGCTGGSPGDGPPQGPCVAELPDAGPGAPYCLVEARQVRVKGGRLLQIGESMLTNVDDQTAVIVARDAKGFHALSAICTHACCLVSLCKDASCTSPTSNPGDCGTSSAVSPDPAGRSILCPCHGSAFRLVDGAPVSGPATRPLPSYELSFSGDDVVVDTSRPTDATTRV